ncbi:hypothetical protein K435DRAFT_961250 [Dendrothele bispora CBS 962.96]|uniref:snRNA-activating protein complex subunit 4 n=1 Tax=Dendrothele bispora (strain CBS 962.96) TaxID=1314807 RepID=A0A4S8MRE3_DENBC|nr:hypothetical protein K435DRAFT_961250 [Dendrothele bispora CBS 962.96]
MPDQTLTQCALQSNQQHQLELTKHAEKLTAELKEIDKLLKAVDSDASDDEPGKEIEVPGAVNPTSIIPPSGFFNPESPFYEESVKRSRYLKNTTMHAMKARELDALTEGVQAELTRLKALENKNRGLPLPTVNDVDLNSDVTDVNWTVVAERVNDISTVKRTPEELRIKWVGDRRPSINHAEWTKAESEMVKLIVQRRQEEQKVHWVDIAKELDTNRTPIECMRRGITRPRHVWSVEGDRRLLEGIQLYGIENWSHVALHVSEHATPGQCQMRYMRTLDPALKKGAWSAEEDERLQSVVSVLGPVWQEVAVFVPGRTNEQCRERYTECLMPMERTWTAEEDAELLSSVARQGAKWKVVSQHLQFASDSECRARYNKLKKTDKAEKTAPATPIPYETEPIAYNPKAAAFRTSDIAAWSSLDAMVSVLPSTKTRPKTKPKGKSKGKGKGREIEISTGARSVDVADSSSTDIGTPGIQSDTSAIAPKPRPKPKAKGKGMQQGSTRLSQSDSIPRSSGDPSTSTIPSPTPMEGVQPAEPGNEVQSSTEATSQSSSTITLPIPIRGITPTSASITRNEQPQTEVTNQSSANNTESSTAIQSGVAVSAEGEPRIVTESANTVASAAPQPSEVTKSPALSLVEKPVSSLRRKRPAEESIAPSPAPKRGRPRKNVAATHPSPVMSSATIAEGTDTSETARKSFLQSADQGGAATPTIPVGDSSSAPEGSPSASTQRRQKAVANSVSSINTVPQGSATRRSTRLAAKKSA